jgi:hypothetical protein
MKKPKRPWLAAVLAFALGGPGCFYLGWRRGIRATLVWLLAASMMTFISATPSPQETTRFDPEVMYIFLLQAGLAWFAYRSCKRSNAEAAKAADSACPGAAQTYGVAPGMDRNLQPTAEQICSKRLKDIAGFVIVGSGFALLGGAIHFNMPPMGEIGNFAYYISPYVCGMGAWGLVTGIGLLRAWRWARISMLVFSSLLAAYGAMGVVAFLFMPNGDMSGWPLFLLKTGVSVYWLFHVAIGVWWFSYFTRNNVKDYFRTSRRAPLVSA